MDKQSSYDIGFQVGMMKQAKWTSGLGGMLGHGLGSLLAAAYLTDGFRCDLAPKLGRHLRLFQSAQSGGNALGAYLMGKLTGDPHAGTAALGSALGSALLSPGGTIGARGIGELSGLNNYENLLAGLAGGVLGHVGGSLGGAHLLPKLIYGAEKGK